MNCFFLLDYFLIADRKRMVNLMSLWTQGHKTIHFQNSPFLQLIQALFIQALFIEIKLGEKSGVTQQWFFFFPISVAISVPCSWYGMILNLLRSWDDVNIRSHKVVGMVSRSLNWNAANFILVILVGPLGN